MADREEQDMPSTAASGADEARAKAEARRRRILEQSSQRMGVVSGEKGKPTDDAPTTSASSRMQAMRRRRFKKQAGGGAPDGTDGAKKEGPSKEEEEEDSKEVAKPVEASGEGEAAPGLVVEKEETNARAPAAEEPAQAKGEETTAESVTSLEGTKKKYLGVAKKRRQMLKEKQKKLEEQASSSSATPSAEVTKKTPVARKAPVAVFPILMHILTVFVLFGAGLVIGLRQTVHEDVIIHRELATVEHGIGVVKRFAPTEATTVQEKDPKSLLESKTADWDRESDEFGEEEEVEEGVEPNIDPLFQVDLDLYTRGDTAFFMIAKGAVALHRVNLFFFYYTPLAIFNAVTKIPQKLMETPPVLMILSLLVRQAAKRVLGAGLPPPPDDSPKEDVLAMMKKGVMNFLMNTFPSVVEVYDAFTHLRADMFIMLCGLLIGITWNHHESGVSHSHGTDEL